MSGGQTKPLDGAQRGIAWTLRSLSFYVSISAAFAVGVFLIKDGLNQLDLFTGADYWDRTSVIKVGVGISMYGLSFLGWTVAVGRKPLSHAFPITVGLSLIFADLAAFLYLGEAFGVMKVFGTTVVLTGVYFISRQD